MAKGKTASAVPEYVDKTSGRINDSGSRSETVARVVAFSDGVIAIIVTIMVLELKTPVLEGNIHGDFDFGRLRAILRGKRRALPPHHRSAHRPLRE